MLGETVRARPRLPTRDSHGDSAGAPRRAGQRSPDHERPRATARPRPGMAVGPHRACRVRPMPGRAGMRRAGGGAARCGMRGVPAARRWRLYHVTINHSFTGVAATHEHDVLGHRTEPVRTDTEPPAAGNRGLLVSPLVASCNRGQSNVSSHTSYDYVQIYALSSRATTHPHLPRLGPSALPWRCVAMRAPPRVAA